MSIDKMRPITLHTKALLLREKCGVEFFLNESKSFVDIDCPVCGSCKKNSKFAFLKYGFTHRICQKCESLYVSPRPTEEKLFEYYSNYEATKFWTQLLIETNSNRKYLQHKPRVEKLIEILNSTNNEQKRFVDLGAGNGNFTKAVDEASIFDEVIASDINEECIESCKQQGLKTHQGLVDDFENDSLDCITFNDLIEHLFNPQAFLRLCHMKLKENGILMLSTPNGQGFDFKILKDKTENITPPEHIQYFNPKSIEIILTKVGFKVIDITTPGILDVSIIKRVINDGNFKIEENNQFLSFLYSFNDKKLEESLQKFLQENKLSSHMLVFAKRV